MAELHFLLLSLPLLIVFLPFDLFHSALSPTIPSASSTLVFPCFWLVFCLGFRIMFMVLNYFFVWNPFRCNIYTNIHSQVLLNLSDCLLFIALITLGLSYDVYLLIVCFSLRKDYLHRSEMSFVKKVSLQIVVYVLF